MYELKIIEAFFGEAYCQAHLQSIWFDAHNMKWITWPFFVFFVPFVTLTIANAENEIC